MSGILTWFCEQNWHISWILTGLTEQHDLDIKVSGLPSINSNLTWCLSGQSDCKCSWKELTFAGGGGGLNTTKNKKRKCGMTQNLLY